MSTVKGPLIRQMLTVAHVGRVNRGGQKDVTLNPT